MRWLTNFFISASNEQLQQELEYTLLKPDCHSWWTSKMQSDTLEERYAIRFCFKLRKKWLRNVWNTSDCFSTILNELASVFEWHKRFKEGRESVRDNEMCGRSKEVNIPELIGRRVRVGVTMLGFKGVQEEITSEEASTFEIRQVAFPPEQCTNPHPHPCHRLFDQDGHQDSSSPSL